MSRKRSSEKKGEAFPTAPANVARVTSVPRRYFWLVIPLSWVLILGGLEGGLRAAGFGHSSALFLPVDSLTLVDNSDYTRRFYSLYDRAELVQKSNLVPAKVQPGRLRVFVVGESTAQGYPFQRNHSFSAITQAALRASGVDVEVLNVGNSAMTSYYLREALADVATYQPDFVAIYAGHNEFYGTPTMFTGGSHWTRLVTLHLKKYRTVQAIEQLAAKLVRSDESSEPLMARRFEEGLFPPDPERDRMVGELFIRNLAAGLKPLGRAGVKAAVFEPVSNLIDMPPFRDAASTLTASTETPEGADSLPAGLAGGLIADYQTLRSNLDAGEWNQDAWVALKDADPVPFRARSALTEMLEQYADSTEGLTWIPTGVELEKAAGASAFSHDLFIDHVHFNFEGQLLLARMLSRSIVEQFYPADSIKLDALDGYLSDPDRVRADIHLTAFWEFEAYTRVASLQDREPFASMPLQKADPPVPERVSQNSLFVGGGFVDAIRVRGVEDLFFTALEFYRADGNRDEWIRNLNGYLQVYPGHYQAHLAYAAALLEDDPRANIDMAGVYFQTAYRLSGRDPEVLALARQSVVNAGLGAVWSSFEARYLPDE